MAGRKWTDRRPKPETSQRGQTRGLARAIRARWGRWEDAVLAPASASAAQLPASVVACLSRSLCTQSALKFGWPLPACIAATLCAPKYSTYTHLHRAHLRVVHQT